MADRRTADRRRRAGRGSGDRARQVRHRLRRLGHRLRRGAQQLFPAGDAAADGSFGRGLGERPRGLRLSPRGLHADLARADACRRGADSPRAARDRLRERFHRGRAGLHPLHAGALFGLAGAGHHECPARKARRLCQQHHVDLRTGEEGRGAGGADRHRRDGDGIRDRERLERGARRGDGQGTDRLRAM